MSLLRRAIPVVALVLVPGSLSAQSIGPLAEHLTILGTIDLEESDSVMTVAPIVAPDPTGGFIVSDPQDSQVRLYDEDGRLRRLVARPGMGPGEVRTPSAAVRRGDGHIYVADPQVGRIMEFDSAGSAELRRYPINFGVTGLHDLGDALLLSGLSFTEGDGPPPLLRIWDGELDEAGFFPAPDIRIPGVAARTYGHSLAAVSTDEIFAAYSLSDTLYVFTRAGRPVEKVALDLKGWSLPSGPPPTGFPGSPARKAWERELHQIFALHVVGDRILVQYGNGSWQDEEAVARLAYITREGETIFDVAGSPRLLTVVGERLYFVDAGSLTDDRWVVASIRDGMVRSNR